MKIDNEEKKLTNEKKKWSKPKLTQLDIRQTLTSCGSGFPSYDPDNPNLPHCS